jgi:phospholipid/cholesterol/gamma-HCH transport system substrate-binding protein
MSDKLKNILIGIFTLMAIGITIAIILFLQPSIGDGKKTLKVRFSNVAGINIGTRVSFAGKPIGEVVDIIEVEDARSDIKDSLGRYYFYELKLKVDSSVDVYDTDLVTIQTTGLMGEKSIAIIPKAPKTNEKPNLINDDIIYAQAVDYFENTANQLSFVAEKLEKGINNINFWFENNQSNLTRLVSSLSNITNSLDNQNAAISLTKTLNGFSENMNLLNSSLNELKNNNTISKINEVVDNINVSTANFRNESKNIFTNLNTFFTNLSSQDTTIGKLINSEDMYLKINAMISKTNTMLNDINHYGVLFQYDKGWQRLRTKRANIMQTLSSPKQFKEYFETELDEINMGLYRLSKLIEKANDSKEKHRILNSEAYKRDFASLLREIKSLEDNLNLYNQQFLEDSKND